MRVTQHSNVAQIIFTTESNSTSFSFAVSAMFVLTRIASITLCPVFLCTLAFKHYTQFIFRRHSYSNQVSSQPAWPHSGPSRARSHPHPHPSTTGFPLRAHRHGFLRNSTSGKHHWDSVVFKLALPRAGLWSSL